MPFTPDFSNASIRLTQVSSTLFKPQYDMPFTGPESTAYYVGDGCQLSYRWHDAFDVFIATLEVKVADARKPITLPVSSHLSDLHLVYQLVGRSRFVPIKENVKPEVGLDEGHYFAAYTPPASSVLQIEPDPKSRGFAMVACVPKSAWLTRHRHPKPSPMEALIGCLRQKHAEHQLIQPAPITPPIRAWLHLLLTTSPRPGLLMDDALHHPTAHLVEQHRMECARAGRADDEHALAMATRQLVQSLVSRLDGDKLLTVSELAAVMQVRPKTVRSAHQRFYGSSLDAYIYEQLMVRAKTMLDGGMTIKAVSLTLGYSTQNNFSRSFKKQYGISPSDYQKNIPSENIPPA